MFGHVGEGIRAVGALDFPGFEDVALGHGVVIQHEHLSLKPNSA